MVMVAVTAEFPVIATELLVPKLMVGESTALAGEDVTLAVKAIIPVNPVTGVRVTCTESPVVAPGAIVRVGAVIVKPGGGWEVTERTILPVAEG